MGEIKELVRKTVRTIKEDGIMILVNKTKNYVCSGKIFKKNSEHGTFKDVLFINGCDESVPHPARYRVTHQREQLEANGLSTNEVYYINLQKDSIRFYRTFVFFRCPHTELIGEFISLAKKLNKKVIFDIDDLVIDTKYTDEIKYLETMSKEEKKQYDSGVERMGKTLQICDAAITTTERLATELSKYVPEVFINRNTASELMCKLSNEALEQKAVNKSFVDIGYFSGSLTHNDDFKLILPVLEVLMKKYEFLRLHVVGELDIPQELSNYMERIVAHPFVSWKRLPSLISQVDINLAPLEDSIFNEAKSENKWVEAALVQVPTVASDVGAFSRMIKTNETGILCKTIKEWEEALERLVLNKTERDKIGRSAHNYCKKSCATIYTGRPLKKFIRGCSPTNVLFVLPSMNISGGIMVALKHASILQKSGYDVTILNDENQSQWCEFDGCTFPVLERKEELLQGKFDKVVATMWTTVQFLESYSNIGKRYYLVQNYETDFYEPGNLLRLRANQSYSPTVPVQFITISTWCKLWLENDYQKYVRYAPNGIKGVDFKSRKRDFSGKIRILIEGDCGVDYKNVDESFKIVDRMDENKFEIWYMSYNAGPKEHYKVNRFLHKVPFQEVPEVYLQCDILLKTSYLESFSYPPLEMMATGGYAVVVPNDGNKEYLIDGENCLLYPQGEIDKAVEAIERLCNDEILREQLYKGGIKTAKERDWENIKKEIQELYG